MTKHFVREMERLNRRIIEFGDEIQDQVNEAIQAVVTLDETKAENIIKNDIAIDREEVEFEEECLKLLALHQPVAEDLRLIIATLKINIDFERVGDHAVNIAQRALELSTLPAVDIPDELLELCKQAKLMLRKSLLALVETDVDLARAVMRDDDLVDDINDRVFREIIQNIQQTPDLAEPYVLLLSVCRQLERIGDHASSISADLIYLLTGDIVRHSQGRSKIRHFPHVA